jgi:RNA polymerase sigma factor (TIGR02999 family)
MNGDPRDQDVTSLLHAWQAGDDNALDRLIPLVYDELHRVARARLRTEPAGHLLQTTALVHEAYLRLADISQMGVRNRVHLLALSGRVMRQILVDHARREGARKRGGSRTKVALDDAQVSVPSGPLAIDVLALNEALDELSSFDPRLCKVVEFKFFAGLNIDETAEALGVSTATVERDWTVAKAWLHQRLSIPLVAETSSTDSQS